MINGLRGLDLAVHLILMVGGADPMNPADEDKVVEMLKSGLEVAKKYNIRRLPPPRLRSGCSQARARRRELIMMPPLHKM